MFTSIRSLRQPAQTKGQHQTSKPKGMTTVSFKYELTSLNTQIIAINLLKQKVTDHPSSILSLPPFPHQASVLGIDPLAQSDEYPTFTSESHFPVNQILK
ncbi:uncharacterized protein J3R85_007607 [Psidium guajava]|nr:uncharacterized protein J3R85_007607 [Psidium guajava]